MTFSLYYTHSYEVIQLLIIIKTQYIRTAVNFYIITYIDGVV